MFYIALIYKDTYTYISAIYRSVLTCVYFVKSKSFIPFEFSENLAVP